MRSGAVGVSLPVKFVPTTTVSIAPFESVSRPVFPAGSGFASAVLKRATIFTAASRAPRRVLKKTCVRNAFAHLPGALARKPSGGDFTAYPFWASA